MLSQQDYIIPNLHDQEISESKSLFLHESEAIKTIESRLKSDVAGIANTISNIELFDPQSNRYFETDIIVICSFGIYVVELKHWSGLIEIKPNSWIQNCSFYKDDPHKANAFKAKLLKGILQKKFPHHPNVYFESVVVLTNPTADVQGASAPQTVSNNPSLDSIDNFLQYLRNQRKIKKPALSPEQAQSILDYIHSLHSVGRPRDFQFPGYEIVKRLYQGADRAELIARRTDIKYHKLSRLRIFYPVVDTCDPQTRNELDERARATLNRMSYIGDHPNLLKVWSIPNENGYIVEGSDWSQTGTLRDMLESIKSIEEDPAKTILREILYGLDAIHRECIIHRALMPENILMVDNVPKLMNFDLSYQLEEEQYHQTVIVDAAKLKRNAYTAPEIYKGGTTPEATSDIFSVGVIFFEMLTGEKPFKCSTDLELMNGELTVPKLAVLEKKGITSDSILLIKDMIRLEPRHRPSTAQAIIDRIEIQDQKNEPLIIDRPLESGEQSGLYIINELICRSATSQIYRATGEFGRVIAIKLFNNDIQQKRIVDEKKFVSAVRDPSIVRVENHGLWADKRFYIAFDWIEGESMRAAIQSSKRPTLEQFRNTAKTLLNALRLLHNFDDENESGAIVHNDIKPDNILLTDGYRPVILDFGSASHPGIGLYEGSEGYVAPDLRLGEDRQYCEDGDLYGLGVSLCEWLTGKKELLDDEADVPPDLITWLKKATAPSSEDRFKNSKDMLNALNLCHEADTVNSDNVVLTDIAPSTDANTERNCTEPAHIQADNPFVGYLNTLHNLDAGGENATAEAQAREDLFGSIHVSNPVTYIIEKYLKSTKRRHVILTGHAGDGKSTIGLELYRKLKGLSENRPLDKSLGKREDIDIDSGFTISIIKDFSEWSGSERLALLSEMTEISQNRFFLISNTGTLLDAFRERENHKNQEITTIEDMLLDAFNQPVKELDIDMPLCVINLAMQGNLKVARKIFTNMMSEANWQDCDTKSCKEVCPIYHNLRLIKTNLALVTERIFLAYRRMREYGIRLTLRQLTGHLGYILTGGNNCLNIQHMLVRRADSPSALLFFNLFFGDDGCEIDHRTDQIQAIHRIREHCFGQKYSPFWEHRLWMLEQDYDFVFKSADVSELFRELRKKGKKDIGSRNQVRRIIYFLDDLPHEDGRSFINTFLNSSKLLDFESWQNSEKKTGMQSILNKLRGPVLHVLQEHFLGIRLPERTLIGHYLYITLNRKSAGIRQGAQIVLARFHTDDFQLKMEKTKDGIEEIQYIPTIFWKKGKLKMQLDLPFLDYVVMRNQGEINSELRGYYLNRMDDFKGKLLMHNDRSSDGALLLRVKNDFSLHSQSFIVENNRLEVISA